MPATETTLRVLIVDDNRDGADTLGLIVEELGNQVQSDFGVCRCAGGLCHGAEFADGRSATHPK